MRKIFLIALVILFCSVVGTAQITSQNARRIISGTGIPNAACSPGAPWTSVYIRTTTGVIYYCSAAPSTWSAIPVGTGDVAGAASSTDNAVARFDLATGKLLQNSVVLIGDTGNISGVGTLALGSGLVTAPSITFGDATTGFYRPSLTTIGVAANGVEGVRFDSVNGLLIRSDYYMAFASTSGFGAADLRLTRAAAANLNLGGPAAAAPVAQTLSVQNVVTGTSNTAGANFTIDNSQGTGTGVGGSFIVRVAPAGASSSTVNALATALTIDSTKLASFTGGINVTSAAAYALTTKNIIGVAGTDFYVNAPSAQKLVLGANGAAEMAFRASAIVAMPSTGLLGFTSTGDAVAGTIDATICRQGANVIQFGTTACNASGSILATNATFSGVSQALRAGIGAASNGTSTLLIDGGSIMGLTIGGNSQAYPVVDTGLNVSNNFSAGNAEIDIWNATDPAVATSTSIRFLQRLTVSTYRDLFNLKHDGDITLNTAKYNTCTGLTTSTALLVCTVSDERVKSNIVPFKGSGLDAIRKIQPISFSFSKGTPYFDGREKLGLSAQNLRDAHPLLASPTGNENGDLLQPEPLALHAVSVSAIKELDARITALEEENKRLKAILTSKGPQ